MVIDSIELVGPWDEGQAKLRKSSVRKNVETWERDIPIYRRTDVLNHYYGEELCI